MKINREFLAQYLADSGLMTAADASSLCESLSTISGPTDSGTVAQELADTGKLTAYQAACVCRGETAGLVFDEYLVLDKIGQGGMGVVLKAQHRRMNRIVAVKKLPTEALESEDAVKRFYREVEAAARLTHPNIVAAYDAREHEGVHYLVMEYVEGQDLAKILKEQGPLPVEEAMDYIIQAAQGLEYAHGEGIIHRDIKPANLLVDKKGTVKILDMGLARIAAEAGANDAPEQLTTTGQVMGTCDYMAPEQAEETHSVDQRADIYSLGCTLYRLLTGQPLYTGSTLMKVLLAHREAEIPSLTENRADVPASVDAVFQKMVAKQPDDRYASMAEVIEALQAAIGRAEAPSVAPEPDSGLMDFLQQVRHEPTMVGGSGRGSSKTVAAKKTAKQKQKTAPAVEETIDLSQADTDPKTMTQLSAPATAAPRPRQTRARRKQTQMLLLIGIGIGLSMIGAAVVAVVVYVQTNRGTIIVDARDQDIQVSVQRGGEEVHVIDGNDHWRIEAKVGEYHVEIRGGHDRFTLDKDTVAVTRGGEMRVKVVSVGRASAVDRSDHPPRWQSLLDDSVVDRWKIITEFIVSNTPGQVELRDGEILLGTGKPSTLIAWTGAFPGSEYELEFEVVNTGGSVFCSPLFPVGGQRVGLQMMSNVVGLHRVDGENESHNPTTTRVPFKTGIWYRVRVLVRQGRVLAWIDEKQIIDFDTVGHTLEAHSPYEPVYPLAFHSYNGSCRLRNIRVKAVVAQGENEERIVSGLGNESGPWQLQPDAPRPAIAPFDADKAKEHQEKWAKYLNAPVEKDIDLPGGEKLTMVLIPPGEFMMGSTEEDQVHVHLTKPFYLGKYEVTQAEWKAVMSSNPSRFPDDRNPVEMVNWNDCTAFIAKLQLQVADSESRIEFALPTAAQWEYACRAGAQTRFYFGEDPSGTELVDYAWYVANSDGKVHPVGEKVPNAWGLDDMHGNVSEWCQDWSGVYQAGDPKDPSGPTSGRYRVRRGGGWNDSSKYCRSAHRYRKDPGQRTGDIGLRVALNLSKEGAFRLPNGKITR